MNARDFSKSELARRAQVDPATIGRYITGERRPGGEELQRVAAVLGVSSDWIMMATGLGPTDSVDDIHGGAEQVFRTYDLSELDVEQASEVARRYRQQYFKATEVLPPIYWKGRLERLVREVQGRAKDASAPVPTDGVDLTEESPEIRGARKKPKRL